MNPISLFFLEDKIMRYGLFKKPKISEKMEMTA